MQGNAHREKGSHVSGTVKIPARELRRGMHLHWTTERGGATITYDGVVTTVDTGGPLVNVWFDGWGIDIPENSEVEIFKDCGTNPEECEFGVEPCSNGCEPSGCGPHLVCYTHDKMNF